MQVCPPDNDSVVCLPSQVVKKGQTLADSDNQSGLRSCVPEGAEALKGDGCEVEDKDTYEESMLDYLHNNQKISSQAEAKVHDTTMDSEVMVCKQDILETDINEVLDGSEDMHPVMMSDSSNADIANYPSSTNGAAENDRFDLPDFMGFDAMGDDTYGNVSGRSLERSAVKAEEAIGDISDDTGSVVIGELDKYVPEHSFATDAVEHEDTHGGVKAEDDIKVITNETDDTHGDVKVEDDMEVNMNENEDTEDDVKVNKNETCTAVDEMKGNTDNFMTSGRTVSGELKEGKSDTIVAGDIENETDGAHPDSVDAHGNLGAVEAVPREDDTTCTDAEMPCIDSTTCAENETVCEDRPCDAKRPLPDSPSGVKDIRTTSAHRMMPHLPKRNKRGATSVARFWCRRRREQINDDQGAPQGHPLALRGYSCVTTFSFCDVDGYLSA